MLVNTLLLPCIFGEKWLLRNFEAESQSMLYRLLLVDLEKKGLKVLGFRDNRPFRQNWWDMLIYGDEPGYEFEDLEDLG